MMKIGQIIQCKACGASSVTKHKTHSMLECQYCGAMMTFSETVNTVAPIQTQYNPAKLSFLLVMIPVGVIALMIVFWLVFQNIRKQTTVEAYQPEGVVKLATPTQEQPTQLPPNIVKSPSNSVNSISSLLTIESQVSGQILNGGKYWVIGLHNNSDQSLARPGVMLSIFHKEGKRIEEQGGWAMREMLKPGEKTVVLLYLAATPAGALEYQINTFASEYKPLGMTQIDIKVKDFSVTTKNQQFEIIGDVVNDQPFNVKFVRIMAVAYNAAGEPIGIGNAFSSKKELAPSEVSGFKVRVGAFLNGEPESWQVWALTREAKD